MIHRLFLLLLAAAWALPATAAVTDISNRPLIVANPDAVKANLLFILDDSGSMNFDFLPDHVNDAFCRSSGAKPENSGDFANSCCINGSDSTACWLNAAPFGTARGQPPFLAAGFNGMAYDPSIRYVPPIKADGTSWDSQTRSFTNDWKAVKNDAYDVQNTGTINLVTGFPDTEWCVDNTFTDCLRNDNYVLPGTVGGKAYTTFRATTATDAGKVATGAPDNASTADRKFGPHYYAITPAEYCTKPDLRNCSTTAGGEYVYPAPVRWCSSDAEARKSTPTAAACQATRNGTFSFARFPTKFFSAGTDGVAQTRAKATFTFSNNPNCAIQVTEAKVGSVNLMKASSISDTNRNNLGNSIRDQIRANSVTTGYYADTTNSGRTVIIYAPFGQNSTATVTLTRTPTNCSFPVDTTTPKFSGYNAGSPGTPGSYAGSFKRVDIHPDTTTYARPSTRTDCAAIGTGNRAGNCTYDEEMTNFANWWAYYHSRMQMMKSSASLAFNKVGNNRRVGYMSINNSTTKDYLNLDTFETTHRQNWFNKLTAAKPNSSTPLRTALSTAGRIYAGKLNDVTLNGTKVKDPVQYSCQRNAAILSTDGFWNEAAVPKRLDGSTDIGDVDSAATLEGAIRDGSATANTLADVSYYYHYTDLRTTAASNCTSGSSGLDVCGTDDPTNASQTMMTFTLGLGVSGYMQFIEGYLGGSAPDYEAVKNRDSANPGSGICSWLPSGSCYWPVPASNTLTTVDDLWHAAVNGGGTYFSASSPTSLEKGLTSALQQFDGKLAAAAAATTSNPNVSAQDNRAFVSDFTSSHWFGELQSQIINLETGKLESAGAWSAQNELDALGDRRILMFGGATTGLVDFKWSNVSTSSVAKYFTKSWITAAGGSGNTALPGLTQFCTGPAYCLSDDNQTKAVGEALVNYLRGVRTNEGELGEAEKYYRARKHVLGDIVNSEAVYVNKALVKYADESHAEFQAKAESLGRKAMVYVGANDGMLHAIDASNGKELWAFVPTAVIPKLYRLADKQYATNHQYFVDSTPFVQDVKVGEEWRTVLIGGLGAGGRAYYALDVTDPRDPKALWEFTNDNLGYTFGQPEIGKLRNGKWVAVLPSGYNNVNPGDGKGRIFVLDAYTGQPVTGLTGGLATSAGTTTTPAGLAHIRGWVNDARLDNTIERVYGGDSLGNVWRFDINDNVGAAGMEALALTTLKNADGIVQPVTSRPELGDADGVAMVYVGTGRYLGDTDLTDTTKQSVYGIKDALLATGHGDVRSTGAKFVQQTLVNGSCPSGVSWCKAGAPVRTTTSVNTVNLAQNGGWFVDLPQSSERVNTDPLLVLGTLVVVSNVIQPGDLCKVGGSSWVNYFDYKTGQASSAALGNVLASRPTVYRLPNQKLVGLARGSDGSNLYFDPLVNSPSGGTRRISWRDLLQQ